MYKILFVSSEAYPLIKTGGLGDVAGSLPRALKSLGYDIRLLMPAYQDAVAQCTRTKHLAEFSVAGAEIDVALVETVLPGTSLKVWLLDHPPAYARAGNPYHSADGRPYPDNAMRFALLSRVAAQVALGQAGLNWRPHIVHCNDWQTGLTPALLSLARSRPATVFTLHNLAYQGIFPYKTFSALRLPAVWWSPEALEFYGQMSFIKGGLVFADRITTVSPQYALEIQTAEFGNGLDGLLRHRSPQLSGILNGIDTRIWNPAKDAYLPTNYSARDFAGKADNKLTLQAACGLPQAADLPIIGIITRLVQQKGIDLILAALPKLLRLPCQFVIIGSGDAAYEHQLHAAAQRSRDKMAVRIGYNEALAHRIEAGADMFLMPSRFEPCGLNQLYSLRYGTVPIVRRVGGLADTVVDASTDKKATGFVFDEATPEALVATVKRALDLYQEPILWRALALRGMRQSFSWRDSAKRYRQLYDSLLIP